MTRKLSFLITLLFFSLKVFSQDFRVIDAPLERIPVIPELKSKDSFFKEFNYIVSDNYKLLAKGENPVLIFFRHTVTDDSSILQIASRCNIPYDTIASINNIENANAVLKGQTLILPTASGIFIKKNKGDSAIEILLKESYAEKITSDTIIYNINNTEFFFLPGLKFSPTERAYFLDATLRLPIDKNKFWISSDFGKRKNPFSGQWKNHNGIDLAASTGTAVHAVKDGIASVVVYNDPTFGNYIILSHDNGKVTSVYAHLSSIDIERNAKVKKGDIIGKVGATGMATGPHLHFEIRQGGVALDPETKLKLK